MLQSLPATPYELAIWKVAPVQFNYHISVDKMHYSVPYGYIKHKVDVRMIHNVIEVFFNNHRICSHPRLYERPSQYSTMKVMCSGMQSGLPHGLKIWSLIQPLQLRQSFLLTRLNNKVTKAAWHF
jgi:hypothetical protein